MANSWLIHGQYQIHS
ncbi:Protein of unknown function [Bacillus cereus]|nr:Protein of unknown function [Bacillus cereus]SCN36528.1 Protein of unknown function [Bacillus wiedmannii]